MALHRDYPRPGRYHDCAVVRVMIDDANQHSAEAAYEAMLGDYDPHDAEMWDGIAADTAKPPVLNVAECEAFIRNWLKDTGTGHITLTSIPASSGNTTTKTFTPDTF